MFNLWNSFILIGIIVLIWIYSMQYHKITTNEQIFTDDLINSNSLKTGDLILFKAYNNFNSIFHGSYFGHIGVVYIDDDPNVPPMLFEANGIERVPLLPHHSKHGVFLTPLAERIKKYKGRCFLKPLNKPVPAEHARDFKMFADYCLNNFSYDYSVATNALKKLMGIKRCDNKTDCGQIVFLSLIKLGLLPVEEYDVPRLHHLRYVTSVVNLSDGYKFLDLIEVIEHPFAY
jgi:hypothetical protein